ncbi:MAG: hypothetical protein ACRDZN_02695, partial [Acidimicrobiales bacterium]
MLFAGRGSHPAQEHHRAVADHQLAPDLLAGAAVPVAVAGPPPLPCGASPDAVSKTARQASPQAPLIVHLRGSGEAL